MEKQIKILLFLISFCLLACSNFFNNENIEGIITEFSPYKLGSGLKINSQDSIRLQIDDSLFEKLVDGQEVYFKGGYSNQRLNYRYTNKEGVKVFFGLGTVVLIDNQNKINIAANFMRDNKTVQNVFFLDSILNCFACLRSNCQTGKEETVFYELEFYQNLKGESEYSKLLKNWNLNEVYLSDIKEIIYQRKFFIKEKGMCLPYMGFNISNNWLEPEGRAPLVKCE